MLKKILKLDGAQKLNKSEQKNISGGVKIPFPPFEPKFCGGDGSFIYVGGRKVCCYIPADHNYIC